MNRVRTCMVCLALSAVGCGCGGGGAVKKTTNVPPSARPVAQEASQEQIRDRYNALAQGVQSVNATMELKPVAGSEYTGVINEYHEVKAFLMAARPYNIRMIGQVPIVGTTVFDMASDGRDFEVAIPTKNKFLIGPVSLNHPSAKPIENLRPQHLVNALLWPPIHREEVTLFEEFNDESARYYILTVLRGGYQAEILHKIWFDRADLHFARFQTYGPKGVLLSDVRYADWQPVDNAAAAQNNYPRAIHIDRPHDEYRLDMTISKITLNENLPADRFQLQPLAGAEIVRLSDAAEGNKP